MDFAGVAGGEPTWGAGETMAESQARERARLAASALPSAVMDFTDLVQKKVIYLGSRNLDDEDLDVLTKVLRESKVLETLLLQFNHITLADGKFTDALAENRTLLKLYLHNSQIGNEGAKRLADALKRNYTLHSIYLWGNQIGDEGGNSLAAAFVVNKSLEGIDLSSNKIGDVGAQSLAASLLVNGSLKEIYLWGNHITDKGGRSLANALRCNHTIERLYVSKISDEVNAKINGTLADPKRKDPGGKHGALVWLLHTQSVTEETIEENARLKKEIANRDAALASKDQQIASQIASRDKELASLRAEIERTDADLAQARKDIASRDEELASKDKQIASLKAPFDQLKLAMETIDLCSGSNEASNKRPREEESNLATIQRRNQKIACVKQEKAEVEETLANVVEAKEAAARSRTAEAVGMVTMNDNELRCWTCGEDYSFDMDATEDDARKCLPVISSCGHTCCHGCILKWQVARAETNNGRVAKKVPCMECKKKSAICPSEPKYDRRLIDLLGRCSR